MSDVFAFLAVRLRADPVHPAMFEAQAARHWDKRLRQRVAGKDFVDLADSRDRAILEDERRRKDTMDRIDGAAATWNAALDRQGVEGIIPTTWPMRWTQSGPIPVRKPHEPDTQGPIDNSRGALTPFPIEWRVGIGPNTRSLDASDLAGAQDRSQQRGPFHPAKCSVEAALFAQTEAAAAAFAATTATANRQALSKYLEQLSIRYTNPARLRG